MTSQIKDPGAHTRQAKRHEGDAWAARIRALLDQVRPQPVVPVQPEPDEEEPWR